MRKIAGQVSDAVSRMLQAGHIKSPPAWYLAVLSNPPPQLGPRQNRLKNRLTPTGELSNEDMRILPGQGGMKAPRLRAGEVRYREDEIRRVFFKDFPFEAMRPTSLVELREIEEEHPVQGDRWTSLEQRGAYPTVEE